MFSQKRIQYLSNTFLLPGIPANRNLVHRFCSAIVSISFARVEVHTKSPQDICPNSTFQQVIITKFMGKFLLPMNVFCKNKRTCTIKTCTSKTITIQQDINWYIQKINHHQIKWRGRFLSLANGLLKTCLNCTSLYRSIQTNVNNQQKSNSCKKTHKILNHIVQ